MVVVRGKEGMWVPHLHLLAPALIQSPAILAPALIQSPAILAPEPPECHAPHCILPGPRMMRALVVGCLPFLHLAQVRSHGDWRQCIVDIYLTQREVTRIQQSSHKKMVITEGITVNRWMHSRDERGKPEEYVCLDWRWQQVWGIIVIDILQLESLSRINGLNQSQGEGEGGVGSEVCARCGQ